MTVKFNGYFHGNEAFKEARKAIREAHVDNYDSLLTIYKYGDYNISSGQFSNLDRAIKKAAKMIDRHSMVMRIKGENKEVNYMIDECYLLMGKAQFYKKDFESAVKTFKYLINNHESLVSNAEASIYLLQSYVFQDNTVEFETFLKKFKEEKKKIPNRLEVMLLETEAMYSIEQLDYANAIISLNKAVSLSRSRVRKNRLLFIIAQLYELSGESFSAGKNYKLVGAKALNYELGFQAKMKYALISADKDKAAILKFLNEMTKDAKNKEFLDQIYYVKGKVHQENGELDESISSFKKSAWSSVKNPKQKALSYLELGNHYYLEKNYRTAQTYLDSSLQSLPQTHPEFDATRTRSTSLTELVEALDVIELQDSLQALAALDEFERIKAIEKVIIQVTKEEEDAERKKSIQALKEIQNAQTSPAFKNNSGVVWIFDNPQALSAGYSEFVKIWGNRELADDWRRSDKTSVEFVDAESIDNGAAQVDENKTIDFYMNQLPLDEEALANSRDMVKENLLKAAEIYNYKLNDLEEANKYLERYINDFAEDEQQAAMQYQLYRNSLANGNQSKAEEMKLKILDNFPTSEYAQLIKNPRQSEKEIELRKEYNLIYEKIFEKYQSNNFEEVIQNCDEILSGTTENPMKPEFALLKSFAIGQTKGSKEFEKELQEIQTKYADSETGGTATLILNQIKRQRDLELLELQKEDNEKKAFKSMIGKTHAFVIIVTDEVNKPNDIKQQIALFNDQFFSTEKFNIQVLGFEEGESIIIVQWIKDDARAKQYFEVIQKHLFNNNKSLNNRYFPVSKDNLKTLIEFKEVEKYYAFFKKNYKL
jgi:tetratricopeptide (TPR) repeat protein